MTGKKAGLRPLCAAALVLALCLPLLGTSAHAEEYKHEHQWQEVGRMEPTCDKMGDIYLHCWICGEDYVDHIPALGHDFNPALDFYNNLFGTVSRHCSNCGKWVTFKQSELNKPNPTPEPVSKEQPPASPMKFKDLSAEQKQRLGFDSDLEWYYRKYYAMPDGVQIDKSSYSAFDPEHPEFCIYNWWDGSGQGRWMNGHMCPRYGHSATCTEWGWESYLPCWICGKNASEIGGGDDFWFTDPPTGHNFGYLGSHYDPAPTCTTPGIEWLPCQNNGCEEKTPEFKPATGHTYLYEKTTLSDGSAAARVYCESCGEQPHATIVGSVWKDKYKVGIIPYGKFSIVFTSASGKKTEAAPLESSQHGYFAELPEGEYTMTASASGFPDRTCKIATKDGMILECDVFMGEDAGASNGGTNLAVQQPTPTTQPSTTQKPADTSSTEKPADTSSTQKPADTSSAEKPAAQQPAGSDGKSGDSQDSAPVSSSGSILPRSYGMANDSAVSVELGGKSVDLPAYALNGNNGGVTNYVRLRDLAALLDGTDGQFDVLWDASTGISCKSHTAYAHTNGTERKVPFSGEQIYRIYADETVVDGVSTPLAAFQIFDSDSGGHTYYQLRDLGRALGFNVGWSAERGVFIETDKPYSDKD